MAKNASVIEPRPEIERMVLYLRFSPTEAVLRDRSVQEKRLQVSFGTARCPSLERRSMQSAEYESQ